MQCPFDHYARLRAEDPVHRIPASWIGRPGEYVYAVSRYDLVAHVLTDWSTFSSRFGTSRSAPPDHLVEELRAIAAQGYSRPPTMLHADPPAHTAYRRLVSKAFTPNRWPSSVPRSNGSAASCATRWTTAPQPVDLVAAYSVPIPTRTIAAALGVPDERYRDFKRWADAEVAAIGRQLDDDAWRTVGAGGRRAAAVLRRRARGPPPGTHATTCSPACSRPDSPPRTTVDGRTAVDGGDDLDRPAIAGRRQRDDGQPDQRHGARPVARPEHVAAAGDRTGTALRPSSRRRSAWPARARDRSASPPTTPSSPG